MKNSYAASDRKGNLMFSEKILPQCPFVHVGFVADKSEMRQGFFSECFIIPLSLLFQQRFTVVCSGHRCHTIFTVAVTDSQLCTFSRNICYTSCQSNLVHTSSIIWHTQKHTFSSKFILLRIIALNNKFSWYSAESIFFFCLLGDMTPGYCAKWKTLQTYVLVNLKFRWQCIMINSYNKTN